MDEELIGIFPVPILLTKYTNDISKEFNFIKNLSYINNGNNGNYKSVNTFVLQSEELKEINKFIIKSLDIFAKKVLLSNDKLIPTISWTNKNPKGSKHHEHVHPNSIVSGVFYFSINKSTPIQFHKNDFGGLKLGSESFNTFNRNMYAVNMASSELVLFPSTTKHSVPTNTFDDVRYSLSFNTFVSSTVGSVDRLTYLNIKELANGNS